MDNQKFNKNDWLLFIIELILAILLFPLLWYACNRFKVSLYFQSLFEELEYYSELLDDEIHEED